MQIRRPTRNALMFFDIPLFSIVLLLILGGLGVMGLTRWFVQDEVRCRRFKGPSKQTHCLWRRTENQAPAPWPTTVPASIRKM